MRDLGGLRTPDGRQVVPGRIFRSANLAQLTPADVEKLKHLGIATVVDLRGPSEAQAHPDRLPATVAVVRSPIIGNQTGDDICEATIRELVLSAGLPESMLDQARVLRQGPYYRMLYLVHSYGTPAHTAKLQHYRSLFRALLELPRDSNLLFHCTGGRDRTGVGAALLLRTLGVSQPDIEADFVASNRFLQPDRENPASTEFLRFESANVFLQPEENFYYRAVAGELGTSPSTIRDAVKLRPELLRRMFEDIEASFGTFEEFLEKGLGLWEREVELLREKLLC